MAFGMNFFRKHQGRLLLVIAVFLMLIWFVGGPLSRLITPEAGAGTVFGKTISNEEYRSVKQALSVLRGKDADEKDVWQMLVQLEEAKRLGIKVTQDEVSQGLRQWVQQATGAKDESLNMAYKQVLAALRTNDQGARNAIEKALIESKLLQMIAGAAVQSDADAWKEYVRAELQTKLKTLEVPSVNFLSQVPKPTDEQLDAYYKANADKYKIPAQAVVEYMAALKKDYASLFPVTDDEVAAYYEQHKTEEFLLPVESTAPRTESSAPTAETSAPAAESTGAQPSVESTEASYKPLAEVAGGIRAKLVEKKASDAVFAARIDMNYDKSLTIKQQAEKYGLPYTVTEPFSQAETAKLGPLADAQTEKDKSVVDLIFPTPSTDAEVAQGPQGIFLFKVTDMKEERQPALSEIKARVESDYLKGEADKLAMQEAAKVLEGLKAKGWGEYQGNAAYKIEDTPLTTAHKVPELTNAAAAVDKNQFGGPVLGTDGAYVFQVIERKEPDIASFNMMKSIYKQMYGARDRDTFIERWREDLIRRAQVTKNASAGAAPSSAPIGYGYGY